MSMVFCRGCGKEIHQSATTCPFCGAVQKQVTEIVSSSEKKILPAFLMCLFLGYLGTHRFYVGKIGSGIAQFILTFSIFIFFTSVVAISSVSVFLSFIGFIVLANIIFVPVIWVLIDLIILACGEFTDKAGNKLTQWT